MPQRGRTRRRPRTSKPPGTRESRESHAAESPIVVLFADIIGCSEISNHKSLAEYNLFLKAFHSIFIEVADEHRRTWYRTEDSPFFRFGVRGDEGCVMLFLPERGDSGLAQDVDTAVNMGLDLKRRWLLSEDNRQRIEGPALLPTELAIGIHLGRAFINRDDDGYRPEGYAINLAKRVESESRSGQYTHVFLSETARGQLELLTDELTYSFGPPRTFQAKGISRDICAFEVKHHFLPADWGDPREGLQMTRALDFKPTIEQVDLAARAHHENPTNLWLAEEYIMLRLQYEYDRLEEDDKTEDVSSLRKAFEDAASVARRLTAGAHRDAVSLVIRGRIAGECFDYVQEQRLYRDAQALDPQYAEAFWNEGLSISDQLYDELGARPTVASLSQEALRRVQEAKDALRRAVELDPRQSWMVFDLATELARWSTNKAERDEAIDLLTHAVLLNRAIAKYITDDEYLADVQNDQRVKRLLPKA